MFYSPQFLFFLLCGNEFILFLIHQLFIEISYLLCRKKILGCWMVVCERQVAVRLLQRSSKNNIKHPLCLFLYWESFVVSLNFDKFIHVG